jgi:hypothetical protein
LKHGDVVLRVAVAVVRDGAHASRRIVFFAFVPASATVDARADAGAVSEPRA